MEKKTIKLKKYSFEKYWVYINNNKKILVMKKKFNYLQSWKKIQSLFGLRQTFVYPHRVETGWN